MTPCWETTVVKIKVIHMNTILVKSFKFQILNNDIKSNSVYVYKYPLYTLYYGWGGGLSSILSSWQEGQKPTLRSLHWLPIYYRADFKVLLSTLKPFKGQDLFTSLNFFTPAAPQSAKNEIRNQSWSSLCSHCPLVVSTVHHSVLDLPPISDCLSHC